MRTIDTRRYEMLVRVRDFGDAHAHLFPAKGLAREQFAIVTAAAEELNTYAVSKMLAAREGASPKAMARKALRDRLETIGRTARAVARNTPGLEDKFALPARLTDHGLLTAGRAFAHDAGAFTPQFVAHSLPDTFLADLNELIEKFDQTIRERDAGKDGHTAAQASIDAAVASGMGAVLNLDVIVANQLHDDPVTMAVWRRDRRVLYPNRVKKVDEAAAPAAVASTPSAAPGAQGGAS